jgi:hypothetical protein
MIHTTHATMPRVHRVIPRGPLVPAGECFAAGPAIILPAYAACPPASNTRPATGFPALDFVSWRRGHWTDGITLWVQVQGLFAARFTCV